MQLQIPTLSRFSSHIFRSRRVHQKFCQPQGMAEQHKASSPADSKEKNPLLDGEIGKGFLSSWKSMSMADDDAMDFSFDTVSKGKKKTFDFEKLDMNFNLDGEFDKISSFKLDMSDLDFTCSPKKTSRSKDKKEEVSGSKAGKQHSFNFSFDFNELDSFNLDSSLIKVDTGSNSNMTKKQVTTEGSDNEGAKMHNTNGDGVHASDDSMSRKSPVSEKLEILKVGTSVGSLGNLVSEQDGSVSEISSPGNLDMPIEDQNFDLSRHKITKEIDQERDLTEKTKSTESKSGQVINMAPSWLACQNDSEQGTTLDYQTKVSSSRTRDVNVSGDKQEVNDKAMHEHTKLFSSGTRVINVLSNIPEANDKEEYVNADGVDLQLEHSSPPHITKSDGSVGEAINLGSSSQLVTTQQEKRYTGCENINKADALKKIPCDNDTRENKETTSECHLVPEKSKPVVDKMMLMKDKNLIDVQSNMFSAPEDKSFLKQPSTTAGTKGISFSSKKKNGDMHLGSIAQAQENLRSNDTRLGTKLVSDSLSGSSKLLRGAAVLLGHKDDPKRSSNTGDSDAMLSSGELPGNIQSFHEEVNKSKATFLETGISTKDISMLSSQVNPSGLTEKTARITTQISTETSGQWLSQKSRIASIEGNKISSVKACKITPALSSLKTLRSAAENIGVNRVQPTSLHQKETTSLVSSGQSMELQGIIASKTKNGHPTDSGENQKSSTPFSKRKTIEVLEDFTSMRPLKRPSQSPSKSRNSKESSEVVVGEVEFKVTEVEIPDSVLVEDNSNVEKAEAYMKELEDICNMLKKKHGEAKELLVRAIVNDNSLLMLNHPIYEEEISFCSFISFPPTQSPAPPFRENPFIHLPTLSLSTPPAPIQLSFANLSSNLQNIAGKMVRLSFCFYTMLLLLSFSLSEARKLRNHDPFSSQFRHSSLFFSTIKHYLHPGSEGRSLAETRGKILDKSVKIPYSIGFRNSNATRRQYYQPHRVSPGGPDAHHHFKMSNTP
ncbi:hypothetical protein RJT34_04511 [Clitoria ternatea]|uniref:Uncharacterized protein n=1 Tax=Clitoria ternatea TaxID=43366 RepID=A0AAN9KMT6_CLITE